MTTKLSTIGKWIGAAIATVVIIGASFLGLHAFNARAHANAELQSGAQSPQSDSTAQSGAQSGDTPQSAEPTPAKITKPTPPKGLQEGGQVGAQTTALWFVELWEYAFNTGDTEEFNQICQDGDFCVRFADEVKSIRENSVVIQLFEAPILRRLPTSTQPSALRKAMGHKRKANCHSIYSSRSKMTTRGS